MSKNWWGQHRVIVILATASLMAGCSGESPEQLLAAAKRSLEKQDSKTAVIQLKNALQTEPALGEARFLLGKALLASGDLSGAGIELGKARELRHASSELTALTAQVLLMQGQPDKVLAQFGTIDLANPADAAALKTTLAQASAASGKGADARSYIDQALQLRPGYARAQQTHVQLLAASQGAGAALTALETMLARDPNNAEAWQMKGGLLTLLGKDQKAAIAAYQEALKRDKTQVVAHVGLVSLLLSGRDIPAAEAALAAFKDVYPNHPQLKLLTASHQLDSGDVEAARESVQALLKQLPDDPRAQLMAGMVEIKRGALPAAERHLSKVLQAAPGSQRARLLLAKTQLRAGEATGALSSLQPLLTGERLDPEVLATAAEAHLQLGDAGKAESLFSKAAQLNPGDARSRTALALAQIGKGQYEQGVEALHSIAAADVGIFSDQALIATLMRKGQYDKALRGIDALERKVPNKPLASGLRGNIALLRGDKVTARKQFEVALKIDPVYLPAVRSLAALDMADKQHERAILRFEQVLSADPSNTSARMAIIEIRARNGASRQELEELFKTALRQNPAALPPRIALARHYLQEKNFKSALSVTQEGLATQPEQVELLALLAQVQVLSGDSNQALVALNKIVTLRPTSPDPLLHLAEFQLAHEDPQAARLSIGRALALKPDYLPALVARFRMEIAAERIDTALSLAKGIQVKYPKHGVGYTLEGEAALAAKKFGQSAAALRAALERQPSSANAIMLHQVLIAGGATAEAANHETRWRQVHPKDAAFLFYLGASALVKGDTVQALQHYQTVLGIEPENAAAANNVAWLLRTLRKPGALDYAEKANRLSPDQPPFIDTLAEILAGSGQIERAVDLQKKAVSLAPELHLQRLRLAKYYLQAGQEPAAREELRKLSALGDKFAQQDEVQRLLARR